MTQSDQHIDTWIRNQVSRTEILTKEDEAELVRRWIEERDHAARDELVLAHRKLVAGMATKFTSSGASFSDLFNEGAIALIAAAERFDPKHNCRFSTYASWWILSHLQEAVHRDIYTVKIGRSRTEKRILRLLGTARNVIGPVLDDAIIEEIAAFSDVTPDVIKRIDGAIASRSMSLNARLGEGEDGIEVGDSFVDENEIHNGAEAQMLARQQRALLERYFEKLPDPRAAAILRARWLDGTDTPLKEIGARFDVSAERIRQIEREALSRLREMISEEMPEHADLFG